MADTMLPSNGTHENTLSTLTQTLQTYAAFLRNARFTSAGITFDGKRDLYQALGYKRALRYDDYYQRYRRGGIAKRLIDAFPAATWRLPPIVSEVGKDDERQPSPFEVAWTGLVDRLSLWSALVRTDRLASLGHYSVLILGLRGQTEWAAPAERVSGPDDLLYVNAYSEDHANIVQLVSVATSPLFGQPALYNVDFSRRLALASDYAATLRPTLGDKYGSLVAVHASRCLHVAENGLEDDIIGTPRLEAVWNYLDDLDKVVGGAGEMFWQDAKRRIVLNLAADSQLDPESETAKNLSKEVDEFTHELRNFLRVQGIEVTQLEGKIPDPTGNIDKQLELIAGTEHIPKRILTGSERGELASSQDENNWLGQTIPERQTQFAGPVILRPFIAQCILLNVLPMPRKGYTITWPILMPQTEKERAETARTWAEAFKAYAGQLGSPQDVLPLEIFLRDIAEFSYEEVARIMEQLAAVTVADAGEGL